MFPGGNSNADLGFNKHNQYMAQPHFLVTPGPGPVPIPGPGVATPLPAAAPVMPMNVHGGIDWAQLAQQWIHMRDSSAAPPMANFSMNMPIAPPPPIISNTPEYHHHQQQQLRHQQQLPQQPQPKVQRHYEEHGEAEMDMDMDEEENENAARMTHCIENQPPPPVVTQSQWIAGRVNDEPNIASHNTVAPDSQQWNDWSTRSNPTAHIPSLLKLNVCNPNEPGMQQQAQLPLPRSTISTITSGAGTSGAVSSDIDANKRKMLPAWIREGLEKMEREKQRQLERQASTSEGEPPDINVKQVSSKSLTTPVNLLNMSNVASDSEDSNAAPGEATLAPSLAQTIGNEVLSKASSSEDEQGNNEEKDIQPHQPQRDVDSRHDEVTVANSVNAEAALSGKNYEERLADLMLVVRRTLTEILLETTNEEIAAIATETLKAHRAKASSAQVIRKSALSSITGNLGLAVYGDSSSESDDDADDNEAGQLERGYDSSADKSNELSMDDLKTRIRKSKRAFEKVIDDIEERVLLQEQLDERKLQQHRKLELEQAETASRQTAHSEHRETEASVDKAGHETKNATTNDKLQQFNAGKRLSRKERTTRFSDNKDGKQAQPFVTQVIAVPAIQSTIIAQKLKPVPNPATNLLQMPESVTTMLSAADKALDKANKTGKKSKNRRRQSTSSSSSSNSGDSSSSSSSSSNSNSSSNSSNSSSNSEDSSTRSSASTKKHKSSRHQSRGSSGHRQQSDSGHKSHHRGPSTSSTRNYDRHRNSRDSRDLRGSRDHRSRRDSRDHRNSRNSRERDRERERRAIHNRKDCDRRRRRDSSQSAEENASSSYRRNSRHNSSRSHHSSSSYDKHRRRTRSRSNSRSTHNSHSSVSTSASHQLRKRK